MAKASKRTRKFEKKHLDAGLKHRRKLKPMVTALRRKAAAFRPDVEEGGTAAVEQQPGSGAAGRKPSQNRSKQPDSDVSQHKEELDTLRDRDPEFYEFLQEHDKELLEFDDEDDDAEEELLSEDNGGEGPLKHDRSPQILTTALVDEWCVSLREKHHTGALRNFLQAFRTACHYGSGEESKLSSKYSIGNSRVFNKIMIFGLNEVDGIFRHILGLTALEADGSQVSTADITKNKKWKKMEPLVKTFLVSSLTILNQMTDNEMIAFTLRRLKSSVSFLGVFPKLARRFLKVALHFLCTGDGIVPALSLFFVRAMALQLGDDYLNLVLRGIYREYAANARFVNSATLPQIRFRANCAAELYGINLRVSYQLVFVFIQQMAVVLRNAITMKTKTAFKSVYCWQYVNCLQLWVKIICMYAGEDELRRLLYPLVQILEGVILLLPTARYFPLRLQCVKMLNELAAATGLFTSVAPVLLDMLQFKQLHVAPSGGVGKALDFDTTLKIPKPEMKSREVHEGYVTAVLEQLSKHLAQWSYAIAFPELAVIPLMQLRQILKAMNVDRFSRKVKKLLEAIEQNVQFVYSKREKSDLSLRDTAGVSAFLKTEKEAGRSPLSQYVVKLQQVADQSQGLVYNDRNAKKSHKSSNGARRDFSSYGKDQDDLVEDLVLPFDGGIN